MPSTHCHAHLCAADPARYPTLPAPSRPPSGTGTVEHPRLFTEALPLTDEEQRLILGENARRIWFPELRA